LNAAAVVRDPQQLQPASSAETSTREAPASTAFSMSSFRTDAGRSTTSPAAIWFARCSSSARMIPMAALSYSD